MRQILKQLHKRLPALVLAVLLLLCCMPFAEAAEGSGSCGDQLTWTLSGETLTIEGSGPMWDFTEPEMAPWYEFRDEITSVILPEGLTTVGNLAFYELKYLDIITIPDTVERVGDYAFAYCQRARMLTIGSGVTRIGTAAFSDCYAVTSLRLPEGLKSVGRKGFYRMESISTVDIPASVTELGVSAFGYCKRLVSANVRANIGRLPEYCFYGCEMLDSVALPEQMTSISDFSFSECDNLTTIYYGGGNSAVEEIEHVLDETVTDFVERGNVVDQIPPASATSVISRDNGDGTYTLESITVTQRVNVTVTSTVSYTHPEGAQEGGTFAAVVNVIVENEDGWDEAAVVVQESVTRIENDFSVEGVAPTMEVVVYAKNTDTVDQALVDTLSGKDTELVVTTTSGSDWRVDCSAVEQGSLPGGVNLSYERTDAPQKTMEELKGAMTYLLKFANSSKVNAEVMVKLPRQYAAQTAYLYQRMKGNLEFLQAVVIDHNGYAHFYLGSVDSETEYIVGVNVPDNDEIEAIVPKEMQAEYGITENIRPVEYVITGRTSSWGMNITQVTWIMLGVIFVVVAAVGVTMFVLNKRKLSRGYVPPDEDDEYWDQ